MHFRQNALDEVSRYHTNFRVLLCLPWIQRLSRLDRSFEKLEIKAEAFHNLQALHAEAQTGLFDQVQSAMQIASIQLAEIRNSAASLQSVVDQTSSKIVQMTTISDFSGRVLRWGWLCLVLFVLHLTKPHYAAYASAVLGMSDHGRGSSTPFNCSAGVFFLLSASMPTINSDTTFIHYTSGVEVRLSTLIKFGAIMCVLSIIAAFAFTYQVHLFETKEMLSKLHSIGFLSGLIYRTESPFTATKKAQQQSTNETWNARYETMCDALESSFDQSPSICHDLYDCL